MVGLVEETRSGGVNIVPGLGDIEEAIFAVFKI